jgi:GntR family transcriptional regulator
MTSSPGSQRTGPFTRGDGKLASRPLDKGVARYYRLYELLSAALADGTLAPGSALPSEPELCARHGISRTTVRRALDRLEREGRIVRKRGSGTYARPQQAAPRLCLELHALPEAFAALESRTTATTLRFEPAPLPAALRAIASRIGTTPLILQRLRSVEGAPLALTTTYLPEATASRVRRPVPSRPSVMTMLERRGIRIAVVSYWVSAAPADADAAHFLEVPLGAPLLRVRAVLSDGGGAPQALVESYCRSDRLQLKFLQQPQGMRASAARTSSVSKPSSGNGGLCR